MKLNRPASFVCVVRVLLVSGSVMRISAPVKAAPCGSDTCPETVPEEADCAAALTAVRSSRIAREITRHVAVWEYVKLKMSIYHPCTRSRRGSADPLVAEMLDQARA